VCGFYAIAYDIFHYVYTSLPDVRHVAAKSQGGLAEPRGDTFASWDAENPRRGAR